jgi:hypothetical protein
MKVVKIKKLGHNHRMIFQPECAVEAKVIEPAYFVVPTSSGNSTMTA